MRRYLVIGHRTLGGAHLMEHLHGLRDADPSCRFHVLVPVYRPSDHAWTDAEVEMAAEARLDEVLSRMAAMGMGATGSIGDANPVLAIGDLLRREGEDAFSGTVLSTLPKRFSRWWDVPHRVADRFPNLPLMHLVADEADIEADLISL
jgi:hypothetical protein